MAEARALVGDALTRLRELPSESVQTVCTSPPYWQLRDYGQPGQIGLEPTPGAYIAALVAVFREVRRVLRSDGSLWLNIGDAYAGSGKGYMADGTVAAGAKQATNRGSVAIASDIVRGKRMERGAGRWGGGDTVVPDLAPKQLMGLPWRLAFALQADGWWLRSEITWCKKAAMPESVRDRPTNATEKIFLLTKSATYYYDNEAVKEKAESEPQWRDRNAEGYNVSLGDGRDHFSPGKRGYGLDGRRNLRNYWLLGPEPLAESHYAAFPTEIPRRAILAGTSEAGACPACGAPWERVVERARNGKSIVNAPYAQDIPSLPHGLKFDATRRLGPDVQDVTQTLGWRPTCSCDASEPVPCLVLDPFAGAFTTGVVARQLGRAFIGIELNPTYVEMGLRRMERVTPALPGLAAPLAPAPRAAQLALEAEA